MGNIITTKIKALKNGLEGEWKKAKMESRAGVQALYVHLFSVPHAIMSTTTEASLRLMLFIQVLKAHRLVEGKSVGLNPGESPE